MFVIIILLAFILIFLLSVIFFFCLAFVRFESKKNKASEIEAALKPYCDLIKKGEEFIKNTPHTWLYIKSFDELKIAGRYYNNNSDRTIFLFHGYRSSSVHDFSCAVEMYYKLGFNVFLADQRSHGKSEGRLITFGVKESRDVVSWCEFINRKYSPNKIIISGISMGATTVLYSLKHNLPKNVVGVIADCGFNSPADIIKKVGKDKYKINASFFIPFLNFACKLFGGFSIYKDNTYNIVKNTELPILFIHGKKDKFVPCQMTEEAFKYTKDNCKMFIASNAGHGMSFLTDTKLLTMEIDNFLNKLT